MTSATPRLRDRAAEALGDTRVLLSSRIFVIGAVIVIGWILIAATAPLISPYPYDAINPAGAFSTPSFVHPFGTDHLGRDVFSRMLVGSRSALFIAPLATGFGLTFGIFFGLTAGYFGGWWNEITMRVLESILVFPVIILAMTVLTLFGASPLNVIVTIGLLFTPHIARTVRSAVILERRKEYIAAAWLQGSSPSYLMLAELLPNVRGPIIIEATTRIGYAIFIGAGLSFLSIGVQEPSADWGLSISLGRPYLQIAPWISLAPALALASLVVGVNLIADGAKEAWSR